MNMTDCLDYSVTEKLKDPAYIHELRKRLSEELMVLSHHQEHLAHQIQYGRILFQRLKDDPEGKAQDVEYYLCQLGEKNE